MIAIEVAPKDLLQVRFGFSPLIEITLSYMLYRSYRDNIVGGGCYTGGLPPHILRWLAATDDILLDIAFPYMDATVLPRWFVADFLTPTPHTTLLSFEDELMSVSKTPRELIWKDIETLIRFDGESDERLAFLHDPQGALYCLIEELRLYWKLILAPHWSRMVSVLEGDVLYRAKQMALAGVDDVLSSLSPQLEFHGDTLLMPTKKPEHDLYPTSLHERGVQLVPTMFSVREHMHWQINDDWHPMLIYAARGVGQWFSGGDLMDVDEAMELTLGASRAKVLQALITPTNTGELAHQLNVTAGSVSQQLNRLTQAGLVESNRSGNRVYYRLSRRGERLLDVFAE